MTLTFTESERRIFARRETLPVSQWASKRLIVQDGIYKGSPLRLDVSPFLAGPMDAFSNPFIREVVVCGSLQVGKTLFLYSCLGWSMDYRPGVKMLAMPTRDAVGRVVQNKLRPLLLGSPALRKLVSKFRLGSISLKDGSSIELANAESPSARASITVQDLFIDEEDLYADPQALEDFRGRVRSYGEFAKIARACQIKGGVESSIWKGITSQVDQLYCYEVTCPACLTRHLPDASHVEIADGEKDPRLVRSKRLGRYRCPSCGYLWSDYTRDVAVANGSWTPCVWRDGAFMKVPSQAGARSVGYHMPAILSRMVSLSDLAARRLIAGQSDNPDEKRQFFNDDLALPYIPVEMATDADRILALADPHLPPRTVPHGALGLTCGIDVQKRGFWYLVRAWMPSLASYVIDYGWLDSWEDVGRLCFDTFYPVQAPDGSDQGERMDIWRVGIDSGGTETEGVYSRTEEVYMWVRANGAGRVFACKGASREQAVPVRARIRERMPSSGRPIPGGLRLYLVDVTTLKTQEFGRMLNPENTHPLRFHAEIDQILADQLSAERMVRKNGRLAWEQIRADNHLLDCLVLSAACADASWTPSLPLYALQLRQERNAVPPPPRPKKREPTSRSSRW